MTTGPPNPTSSSDFTFLLSGRLDDFLLYSVQEQSQWLIDIAHDISDPTPKCGSLQVWDVAGEMWRNVNPNYKLLCRGTLMWSVTDHIKISLLVSRPLLPKTSERVGKSRTSATGNAATMTSLVKQRDRQQCWVTRMNHPIINSHVCPKRMGDHIFRKVYSSFVSTPPPALSIYGEIYGISPSRNLDNPFGTYELGLRLVPLVRSSCFPVFYS